MPRNSEPTRRRILDAAYELFYRMGFSRVGVDEVAAFARVTKRTLYYHFRSKDELLAAVLELHHDLALARVRKHADRYTGRAGEMLTSCSRSLPAGRPNRAGRAPVSLASRWNSPTCRAIRHAPSPNATRPLSSHGGPICSTKPASRCRANELARLRF